MGSKQRVVSAARFLKGVGASHSHDRVRIANERDCRRDETAVGRKHTRNLVGTTDRAKIASQKEVAQAHSTLDSPHKSGAESNMSDWRGTDVT